MVRLRMAAAIAAMWEQAVCAQTLCGFAAGFGVTRRERNLASLPFSICGTLVELCHMSIIYNSHMRKFTQSVKKKERKAGSAKLPNWARSAHRLKPSATVTTGVAHARPAAYAHRPRCGRVRDCSTLRLQTLARLDSPFSARLPTSSHRTCVGWTCEIEAPCDVQHCDGAKSARLIQNRVRADDCRARDTSHAATSVAVRPQVPACHRAGTESRKLVFSEPYRVTQLHEPLHARAASLTHRVGSR